ncbi:hypothetical protein NYZ21_21725, partial [Acinetobacter baumannii]|nr:hypothetical protein [Acinetobacter baumannii]
AITDMPQMVALYNGMGGGSAAAIGAVELLRASGGGAAPSRVALVLAVIAILGPDEKIPAQERLLSAGCVCFALLQAAQAMGFGAS